MPRHIGIAGPTNLYKCDTRSIGDCLFRFPLKSLESAKQTGPSFGFIGT